MNNFLAPGFYDLIILGVVCLLGLIGLSLLIYFMVNRRQQGKPTEIHEPALCIDLSKLPQQGPDVSLPKLEFYSTPVRLAILVIAPKGHSVQVPNNDQLMVLVERIAPGMSQIIQKHQPMFQVWPAQMSNEGFHHSLFHNIVLPGDEGRGSPWCGASGYFTAGMGSILVGVICVAAEPNQLGKYTIEHEGQWRSILQVSEPETANS